MSNTKKNDGAKHQNPEGFGIYVRNFSTETKENDLVKYFTQFGSVTWVHFGHDYLLLDFKESGDVKKVMAKKFHFLNGRRLYVRHKISRNMKVPMNVEETVNKLHQSIAESLQGASNLDEELTRLIEKLQPSQSEFFVKQNSVCRDLFHILLRQFDRVQVHPFGSALTGLGFDCTSDIDVHLANVKYADNEEEVRMLHVIKKELVKSGKFGNTFVIGKSKIAIVKTIHLPTGIPCDINIRDMFGVWNSKLIHYYMKLDPKIKRCMIALKYWAKRHHIPKSALNSYSLVMLFLFYLQDVFQIPSVHQLQQHPNLTQINNWTVDLVPDINFFNEKLATSDTLQVLKNFFKFYSEFEFNSHIIVPYLGQKFPRQNFASADSLPETCHTYKTYLTSNVVPQLKLTGAVCVQDPIEHFRNITAMLCDSTLERFTILCKMAFAICSTANNENVLLKLLTEEPHKPECSIKEDSLLVQLPNTCLATVARLLDVTLSDILCFTIVEGEDFEFNCTAKKDMWMSRKATAKRLNLNKEENLIERELKITRQLKEDFLCSQISDDILTVKLTLQAHKEGHVDGVSVSVQKLQAYKKSFKCFARFFASNLPLWLQAYKKIL